MWATASLTTKGSWCLTGTRDKGQKGRAEGERTGLRTRGKRCAEREAWAAWRAGCRSAGKCRQSRREGGQPGGPGGPERLREGHREGRAGCKASPALGAGCGFRLSSAGPAQLPGPGGPRAHFLTRLRAALKGPLAEPSALPAAARSARHHLPGERWRDCTCPGALPPFSLNPWEVKEGFSGAGESHISRKGFVTVPATLTICFPGFFRSTRLGHVHLHHFPRK